MKRLLPLLAFLFCASPALASDIYVAQSLAGGNTGADCANARAMSSLAGGDWTAGNTIHLCGTLTSVLTAQGSGSVGNVITVKFEASAKFSFTSGADSGQIDVRSRNYIVVDGGGGTCGFSPATLTDTACNGTSTNFEAPGNGTGGTAVGVIPIWADSSDHVEVKGMQCGIIYNHTSLADQTLSRSWCVRGWFATNLSVHNNTMHDTSWAIDAGGSPSASVTVYNNEFYRVDHGTAFGNGGINPTIYGNHFHDFANWDTTAGTAYHHDGVHMFTDNGNISNAYVYNNLFNGDIGNTDTSWIYLEAGGSHTFNNRNVFNNVLFIASTRNSCCGMIDLYNQSGATSSSGFLGNNTVFGASAAAGPANGWLVAGGQSNARVQNNAIVTCAANLAGVNTGATFAALSNNVYCNSAGSNSFNWHGSFTGTYSTWAASSGEVSGFASTAGAMNIDTNGTPLAGSNLIGAGANLTSLCSGALVPLCSDMQGNARPAIGAWDVGAYEFAAGTPTAATPSCSPGAGAYVSTQSVTCTDSSGSAIMCYTTNGTTPATDGASGCTTGTLYSTAITVSVSETLKVIAGGTGFLDGSVASYGYVIGAAPSSPFNVQIIFVQ